jgi:GT2 family glycosyltransferase
MVSVNHATVGIVIVNWNAGVLLRQCVESIIRHGSGLVSQIVVVDNASTDGSETAVEDLPVTLIRNADNLGFASACNQGARVCDAPYLLFLNPDAAVFEDTLALTLQFMQDPAHLKIGICGVKLIDDHGKVSFSCSRFPSLRIYLSDSFGLSRFWPRYFKAQTMFEWPHDETRYVDQVMGAYFLIRSSLFDQLDGFDERFFVYSEEIDLSYRAHRLGYRSIFLADVAAYHRGCASSDKVKAKRLFYYLRSRILYAFKHFNPAAALLFSFTTLCIEPLARLGYALARRSSTGVLETLKGFGYLWAWIPKYVLFGRTR